MAEMVSSAVVQETVNKIVSAVLNSYEGASCSEEQLERLEMAHIKLEAALETSQKWHIRDTSLLRWQKKLKRAAQECDDTMIKFRQELQKEEVRNSSSFPKRFAHATKSLISSIFYDDKDDLSRSVRRFEWFADGASEFLRHLELGGTPWHYTFFDPFIRHLLAGKTIEYRSVQENRHYLVCIYPFSVGECRTNARLIFQQKYGSAPEDNVLFSLMLELAECMDIVGIAIQCLQLFAPYCKHTVETIRKELTQLPRQDFSKVSNVYSHRIEPWQNIHGLYTRLSRPNPKCCKQQDLHKNSMGIFKLSDTSTSLEHVIDANLEHFVLASRYDKQMTTTHRKRNSPEVRQILKLRFAIMPHGSSEDHLLPKVESSVVEAIDGKQQYCLQTNITFEQLGKNMLSKAVDCLHQNARATVYRLLWKSRHGSAYFQAENKRMQMVTKRRTIQGARNRILLTLQDNELNCRKDEVCTFLNLWTINAPIGIQSSIMDWIRKEMDAQLVKDENGVFWGTAQSFMG